MKLSQSNFNLRSPDSDSVGNYLIATVSLYDANAFLANKEFDNVLYFLGKTQLFALLRVKIT